MKIWGMNEWVNEEMTRHPSLGLHLTGCQEVVWCIMTTGSTYFGFSFLRILKNLNGFLNLRSSTASAGICCSAFPITSSHLPTLIWKLENQRCHPFVLGLDHLQWWSQKFHPRPQHRFSGTGTWNELTSTNTFPKLKRTLYYCVAIGKELIN